jgi:hypothetical protein
MGVKGSGLSELKCIHFEKDDSDVEGSHQSSRFSGKIRDNFNKVKLITLTILIDQAVDS